MDSLGRFPRSLVRPYELIPSSCGAAMIKTALVILATFSKEPPRTVYRKFCDFLPRPMSRGPRYRAVPRYCLPGLLLRWCGREPRRRARGAPRGLNPQSSDGHQGLPAGFTIVTQPTGDMAVFDDIAGQLLKASVGTWRWLPAGTVEDGAAHPPSSGVVRDLPPLHPAARSGESTVIHVRGPWRVHLGPPRLSFRLSSGPIRLFPMLQPSP